MGICGGGGGGGGEDRWTHSIESKGLSHAIRFLFNTLKRVFVYNGTIFDI